MKKARRLGNVFTYTEVLVNHLAILLDCGMSAPDAIAIINTNRSVLEAASDSAGNGSGGNGNGSGGNDNGGNGNGSGSNGNNGDGNGLPSSPASSAASAPVMRGGAAGGGYYY